MKLSPKILHLIRLWIFLIALASILVVFLSSIPQIGQGFGLQQFGVFLACSVLSIFLIDICVVDVLKYARGRGYIIASLSLITLFCLIMGISIRQGNSIITFRMLMYVSYGLGILFFCLQKLRYHDYSRKPNVWSLVTTGSGILGIFLTMCYASMIVSRGRIQEVNCKTLQDYSTTSLAFFTDPFQVSRRFAASVDEVVVAKPGDSLRQRIKKEYLDDLMAEKKLVSQNACEVIFAQISTKIEAYEGRIHASLFLLLFLLLRPFVIFFIWLESIIAYCFLSMLVGCGIYKKVAKMREVEQRE